MVKRNDVIKALECLKNADKRCGNPCEETGACSYAFMAMVFPGEYVMPYLCDRKRICEDAVELLGHEPVKPIEAGWSNNHYYICGACHHDLGGLGGYPSYCPECGKQVNWDA